MDKKVVVMSDLHSGHRAGLTSPGWQYPLEATSATKVKYAKMQRYVWDWYTETIKSLQPIDVLIVNGDAVDGKGYRSGGTEQITTDMNDQIAIAQECIEVAKAQEIVMTHGTEYHVGSDDDWETPLAKSLGATIVSHHDFTFNGVVFDLKHHIGGSSVPYGRNTAPAKEAVWDILLAVKKGKAQADVIIRSHVHYFTYCGDGDVLAIITPALQGPGSKFGAKKMSGTVDMGLLVFDIKEDGRYSWHPELLDMEPFMDQPIEL